MKINTRARYALRLMIELANNADQGRPLNLKEISGRQGISKKYLGQIVMSLKNNSLLKGVPGKSGGYVLAKKAESIRVGDIFTAAIGPVNVVDCVESPELCIKSDFCECRPVYVMINERVVGALNEFTLDVLAAESRKTRRESATGGGSLQGMDRCSSGLKG